jgi:hypothetical protein
MYYGLVDRDRYNQFLIDSKQESKVDPPIEIKKEEKMVTIEEKSYFCLICGGKTDHPAKACSVKCAEEFTRKMEQLRKDSLKKEIGQCNCYQCEYLRFKPEERPKVEEGEDPVYLQD